MIGVAAERLHCRRLHPKDGSDTPIGNIVLGVINRARISMLIRDTAWHGPGFATDTITRVTSLSFEARGLSRIEVGGSPAKRGSQRTFLKNEYVVEGFHREVMISAKGERPDTMLLARLANNDGANKNGPIDSTKGA